MKIFATWIAGAVMSTALLAQTATTMTEAEVRKIDREASKITLKHEEIKNLDMPPMTMVFQVKDASLLDKAKVGDKVLFTAEKQQGAYVLTGMQKQAAR